jgi:uncharacterized protein (TIGR03032 family)
MNQPPPPFSCTYSPNVPEFFRQAACTLVVSTYQAGKVIFLSAQDDEKLVQLPRNFRHAMALGVSGDKLAVAAYDRVEILRGSEGLAPEYPNQKGVYDVLYAPQATYYTGPLDIHGLEWGKRGLWAVNTAYSCLCMIGENYSFFPRWKPPFISEISPGDKCHLNGVAMRDDSPAFVTAFNTGNTHRSWKEGLPGGGVLIDVESGEIAVSDLPMPHTPRWYDDAVYLLLSASGELVRADVQSGRYDVVTKIDGFVRGMARIGDYVFVAYSRLRQNSSIFRDLDIAKANQNAGIEIVHLPTGARTGNISYRASVDEIFDIHVLPGRTRPGIINPESDHVGRAVVTPSAAYWAVPQDRKEHESTSR